MELSISKSQYLKGLQCPKALWLYRHRKDLAPKVDTETQARFDVGHEIGQWAMKYFEGGVEITLPYWDIQGAISATEEFIQDGHQIIFEATAIHPVNGCYSRIDILKRVEGTEEWDMIEVKSSTAVKDYHIDDVSFQYHVFVNAGYRIRKCFMMLIDNSYVRQGSINPHKLFKLEDISDYVFAKQNEADAIAGQLGNTINEKSEPNVSIGARCFAPFECDYRPYCWKHVPEYSVYDVFQKSKAEDLAQQYGVSIEALPEHIRPSGNKAKDVESYLKGETIVDSKNLFNFLGLFLYPLYYLDYETLMPAIPLFDGTRPYQQIPFQFSLHIKESPTSEIVHHEFLHKDRSDPRLPFVEKLIELCGDSGTIIVYNQAFEIARNNELAKDFPQYASEINSITARMEDLLVPFKNRWLYHPDQKSSASIKAVLPCFTNLSYEDLEIGHGAEAMLQYQKFMEGSIEDTDLDSLWNNLTEYCKQDTYAMKLLTDFMCETLDIHPH